MSKWIEPSKKMPKEMRASNGRRTFLSDNVFLTCRNKHGVTYVVEGFADDLNRSGYKPRWKEVVTCTEITDEVIAWMKIWRPLPYKGTDAKSR